MGLLLDISVRDKGLLQLFSTNLQKLNIFQHCYNYYFFFLLLLRFDRKWFLAVEMFLFTTVKLVKRMLYPSDDHETVKQAKESIKRKTRKKTGKDKKLAEKCEASKSVYQHFFSQFGGLFFLEHRSVYMHSCKVL